MESLLDSFAGGAGFGIAGVSAFGLFRYLLQFSSDRADKREAHIDEATRELITQLREQMAMLAARLTATEKSLADCQVEHHRRDIEMNELRALVQKGGA